MSDLILGFYPFDRGPWRHLAKGQAWKLAALCWVPYAIGGEGLIADLPRHVRFLVALPVLVAAEKLANRWISRAIRNLMRSELLSGPARRKAEDILGAATRIRSYPAPKIAGLLLIVAIAVVRLVELATRGGLSFSEAWVACVGIPITQVALLRWVFASGLWTWMLWRFSRIRFRIAPSHPDTKGGIGFFCRAQQPFAWLTFALACVVVADQWSGLGPSMRVNWSLSDPWTLGLIERLGILLAVALAVFVGPLLLFSWQLFLSRDPGILAFSRFTERCVRVFDRHWVSPQADAPRVEEPVLNPENSALIDILSADIQTRRMKSLMVDRATIQPFVVACLLPVVPLIAPKISGPILLELAKKIFL